MDTLGDRLIYLRNERNETAKEVMEKIAINDLGRFEKNERKPSVDTLLAIANHYNVTTDWLLKGEIHSYTMKNVDNDELELLTHYKKLGKEAKARILERTQTLLELKEAAEKAAKQKETVKPAAIKKPAVVPAAEPEEPEEPYEEIPTIEMCVYDQKASAGLGNYLIEDSSYETVSVNEDEVPAGADFGVRIKGDSMEPYISNGEIVWVKEQVQLENGQIGIFILDEEAYCKKIRINHDRQEVYLVSLNPAYPPITIKKGEKSKFLRTVGRVL